MPIQWFPSRTPSGERTLLSLGDPQLSGGGASPTTHTNTGFTPDISGEHCGQQELSQCVSWLAVGKMAGTDPGGQATRYTNSRHLAAIAMRSEDRDEPLHTRGQPGHRPSHTSDRSFFPPLVATTSFCTQVPLQIGEEGTMVLIGSLNFSCLSMSEKGPQIRPKFH